MPLKIKFDKIPAGIAVEAALRDEPVMVSASGSWTSGDGQDLVAALEGFVSPILSKVNEQGGNVVPSMIDSLLVVIDRDASALVYVNEIRWVAEAVPRRAVSKGEPIARSDLLGVRSLRPEGVSISETQGFLCVLTSGWRRALVFDYSPLHPSGDLQREHDPFEALGRVQAHLLFEERFAVTDERWDAMLRHHLFPFADLPDDLVNKILALPLEDRFIRDLEASISSEVEGKIEDYVVRWGSIEALQPHFPFLRRAADRIKSNDLISAASILAPRVEGIVRTLTSQTGADGNARIKTMLRSAVSSQNSGPGTILMPERFAEFLQEHYFPGFNSKLPPGDDSLPLTRNTIGHGVAGESSITRFRVATLILVVQQLSRYVAIVQSKSPTI